MKGLCLQYQPFQLKVDHALIKKGTLILVPYIQDEKSMEALKSKDAVDSVVQRNNYALAKVSEAMIYCLKGPQKLAYNQAIKPEMAAQTLLSPFFWVMISAFPTDCNMAEIIKKAVQAVV